MSYAHRLESDPGIKLKDFDAGEDGRLKRGEDCTTYRRVGRIAGTSLRSANAERAIEEYRREIQPLG